MTKPARARTFREHRPQCSPFTSRGSRILGMAISSRVDCGDGPSRRLGAGATPQDVRWVRSARGKGAALRSVFPECSGPRGLRQRRSHPPPVASSRLDLGKCPLYPPRLLLIGRCLRLGTQRIECRWERRPAATAGTKHNAPGQASLILLAFRPCAGRRKKWSRTRSGSSAPPNIWNIWRPSTWRCSQNDRRRLACGLRRVPQRHVRSRL